MVTCDVNCDGVDDLLVGASQYHSNTPSNTRGRVFIYTNLTNVSPPYHSINNGQYGYL